MSDKYILDGRRPVPEPDLLKWADWFESAPRRVADDQIGEVRISTVFLGIDHNFSRLFGGDYQRPILFETMVFGGVLNQEMDRYSTWDEAEAGHALMVERVKARRGPTAAGPSEGSRRTPDSNARGGTRWYPGPWRVRHNIVPAETLTVTGADDDWTVADCLLDRAVALGTERHANAQLIAAAPDLYEALRELLAWEAVCGTPEEHGAKCERRRDAQEQARAALAKARGQARNAEQD